MCVLVAACPLPLSLLCINYVCAYLSDAHHSFFLIHISSSGCETPSASTIHPLLFRVSVSSHRLIVTVHRDEAQNGWKRRCRIIKAESKRDQQIETTFSA